MQLNFELRFMPYVNNKYADQPALPPSLISILIICSLDCIIPIDAIPKILGLKLASVAEQAGLGLTSPNRVMHPNGKQCRPWSDCFVCLKTKIIIILRICLMGNKNKKTIHI